MRTWTAVFVIVAATIAAIMMNFDAAAIGVGVARMLFAFVVVSALLHGIRVVTLQMALPTRRAGLACESSPRRHAEGPRAHHSTRIGRTRAAAGAEARELQ